MTALIRRVNTETGPAFPISQADSESISFQPMIAYVYKARYGVKANDLTQYSRMYDALPRQFLAGPRRCTVVGIRGDSATRAGHSSRTAADLLSTTL